MDERSTSNEAHADRDGAVAVIVVHGVADQPRGETADAVAMQLALELGASVSRADVPLEVAPCTPAVPFEPWDTDGWRKLPQAIRKSWGSALRSDFLDPRLGGADSERASPKAHETEALANSAMGKQDVEPGVRFTDFLLAKTHRYKAQLVAGTGLERHLKRLGLRHRSSIRFSWAHGPRPASHPPVCRPRCAAPPLAWPRPAGRPAAATC